MQGVKRYCVRLLAHDQAWEEEYEAVSAELAALWGDNIIAAAHVGSTAIPAICAKPILDVAVRLRSIKMMDIDKLLERGYSYCGAQNEAGDHHLFVLRGENELSLRHIHCYDSASADYFRLVNFRDYLRAHREAAKEYESLKLLLAEKYPLDRVSYTAGKEEFIQRICEYFEEESEIKW